jgi:hypothetical protein
MDITTASDSLATRLKTKPIFFFVRALFTFTENITIREGFIRCNILFCAMRTVFLWNNCMEALNHF